MRGLSITPGVRHGARERNRGARIFARHWSIPLALLIAAGCAEQEDPDLMPSGGASGTTAGSGSDSGSSSGGGGGGGNSSGSSSGGAQAGTSSAGSSSGSANGGSAGSGGGAAGASMAGGGAGGTSAGAGGGGAGGASAGAGGKGGAGGTSGSAGAGGKGGAGGSGGTAPVEPCSNGKKDGSETDVDCGGSCTTKCATGKGCDDLRDCVASNVCDADKCRANGCNASNCAYTLTRFIVGSTAVKGQVFVDWDSDSLDLRFEMLDATPFDDQADSALNWQDDSVEIYVDLNNAKTATYQADDFQLNVPRMAGNNVVGIGTNLNTGAVTVTRTSSATGYTLIVGIPWTALNNAAYPSGKTIGFDVAVNDDSDGGDRNSQIMLYGGVNNWNNTSQFGMLTITP
jgi:hypothetical protein